MTNMLTLCTLSFSSFVTRLLDSEMHEVGSVIHTFLTKQCEDYEKLRIKKFNSMVFLGYTGGKRINWHTDQRYTPEGKFMSNHNSQEEDTVVAILTIGHTRHLHMRCVRYNRRGERRDCKDPTTGPIPVDGEDCYTVTELPHGSLFVLRPEEEVPFIRVHFDSESPTFFQHCAMYNAKDGLSIALVFRTTTSTVRVWKDTGLLADFNADEEVDKAYAEYLSEFAASDERKTFDKMMSNLHDKIEKEFLSG